MGYDKATAWLVATREAFKKQLNNKPKPEDGVLVGPIKPV